MSRKDFNAIAAEIRKQKLADVSDPLKASVRLHYLALNLADYFEKSSPTFDVQKFMQATEIHP